MKDKRLPRREREKVRRRGQMLAAALDLFSEKGYHNVSMNQIAERAEFAVGTLYKFFKNKEDLYKSLIVAKAEEYHRVLKEVLAEEKDDLRAVLKDYIGAKARIFARNVAAFRLYFAETHGASFNIKAGLDRDIRGLYDDLVERLATVFTRGIRKEVIRKLNPYYMAMALEEITNAFLLRWLEDPKRHPYEANVPMITDMFFDGVLAKWKSPRKAPA